LIELPKRAQITINVDKREQTLKIDLLVFWVDAFSTNNTFTFKHNRHEKRKKKNNTFNCYV